VNGAETVIEDLTGTDSLRLVRELRLRAVDEYAAARPSRARTLARRALQLLTDLEPEPQRDGLRARVLITLALSESELSGLEAGLAVLAEAESYAADPSIAVLVRSQRGALAIRAGDLQGALAEYAGARELIAHAEPFDRCVILVNEATLHLYLGDLRAARSVFQEAIDFTAAHGMLRERAKALHNLGYVEYLAGNLPTALRQMDEAAASSPDLPEGIPLLDRARVLTEAGLVREADFALAGAAEIFRRDRLAQDLAEVELERANAALTGGDVAAGRRFAARARDRFRRRGIDRWRRSAELLLLQGDLALRRRGSRLVGPAMRLRTEFAAEGLRLLERTAGLIAVEAHLNAGQVDAGIGVFTDIGAAQPGEPITARLHLHYVAARVDAACGRKALAVRRVRRALDELADYQASFGSIDLRTASAVHGRRLAEFDISLALDGGRAASVFAAAERARAVSNRLPSVLPPEDPVGADLLAELRQTIDSWRAVEQDRAAAEPLLRRRRDLERRIVARTWTVSGSGSAVRAAGLAEVRARLAERGRTMVTYVQAAGGLWAVVVGTRVRLHDLGPSQPVVEWVRRARADLDVLAQPRLPGGLRGAVRSSLNRSLAGLDAALAAPLGLAGHPLAIVSTGVLGQLPWASLPSLRGASLAVAPSATKWLASTEPRNSTRTDVVAVAGPDLGRGGHEVQAVGGAWRGSRTLTATTRVQFAAAMASADVLHVAAHGVHQPENPLFSSLRMADGPIFAHELDQSALAPEHVVLSACEVGLATVRPGDEALGLASVLLNLGTRSVIAGVARVADDVAAQTMAGYHAKLAGGVDSAAALAAALIEVDSDVTPPFVAFGATWSA
jgi:tetratricopeptide (TPR) repeat protein